MCVCVCVSDEEEQCLAGEEQITDEMISSHEMISSLELTTSASDSLSDKENVVRVLKLHMNSTNNRLSNTVSSASVSSVYCCCYPSVFVIIIYHRCNKH